jgi:hypothetical protein
MAIRIGIPVTKRLDPLSNSTKAGYKPAIDLRRKINPFQGRAFLHGRAIFKLNEARTTLFHGIYLCTSHSLIETARYKQIHSMPICNSWIH